MHYAAQYNRTELPCNRQMTAHRVLPTYGLAGSRRPANIMKLKVHRENTGLCGSCRHATIAETKNGRLLIVCDWFNHSILEPIVVCSKHSDRRQPGLTDMRNTAWILQTDEKKKVIGFISNKEWRKSRSFREEVLPDVDGD